MSTTDTQALPKPAHVVHSHTEAGDIDLYTADQMREYAAASLASNPTHWKVETESGILVGVFDTPRDALAANYYGQKVTPLYSAKPAGITDAERAELGQLRLFAGGKLCSVQVQQELGPMSLWSEAGLEAHIQREVAAALALAQPAPQGWRTIESAPEGVLCICGWRDPEDSENPDRHMFDYLEDGVWQNYFSEHEHYAIAGVAHGLSEDAPYTHWMAMGTLPLAGDAPLQGEGK